MANEKKTAPITRDSIRNILAKFDVSISDSLADGILEYVDLLARWNEKINLTSIRDPLLIVERHFGESLFGAACAEIDSGALLDVGSGAGFPALPIAMLRPKLRAVLLEPNAKKAAFLAEACRRLELSDRVNISRSRLEKYSGPERFDFVTSRAVRVTSPFLDQCLGFIKESGKLTLWLGFEDAKAAAGNPGWAWGDPVRIPGSDQRCLLTGKPQRE